MNLNNLPADIHSETKHKDKLPNQLTKLRENPRPERANPLADRATQFDDPRRGQAFPRVMRLCVYITCRGHSVFRRYFIPRALYTII